MESSPKPLSETWPKLSESVNDDFNNTQSGWPTRTNQPDYEFGYETSDNESKYYISLKQPQAGTGVKNSSVKDYLTSMFNWMPGRIRSRLILHMD